MIAAAANMARWLPPAVKGYIPMAVYALIAAVTLWQYIPWASVNFIIGLIGLPVAVAGSEAGRYSSRFIVASAACVLLYLLAPYKTFLYFGLCFAAACTYEQQRGRLAFIPVAIMLLTSPVAQYMVVMFSFPIRLWLTGVAGSLLNAGGLHASVAGNLITAGTKEYSVDPACMGLKMLLTSLLCGLLLVSVMQRRHGRQLRWPVVIAMLAVVVLLNMAANVARILTLVFFDIAPGNALHEVTGLIYLAVYVLLPAALLANMLVRRFGRTAAPPADAANGALSARQVAAHTMLALAMIAAACLHGNAPAAAAIDVPAVYGYTGKCYDKNVRSYSSPGVLVYIKKTNGLLGTEHNPAMCWLGAGYRFASINEERIGTSMAYTATLVKGNELLYTAWWYDNGHHSTTGQLAWRYDELSGGHSYSIINVTTASRQQLISKVQEIRSKKVFLPAL